MERDERIGPYRLGLLLGEGGMGKVYRATHNILGRQVALKILDPSFSRQRDKCNRFLSEMRLAAIIQHPNVVTIYDAGEEDGQLYFAMERLSGDLGQLVDGKNRLSHEALAMCALDMAKALVELEANDILHRDIKPSNILMSRSGNYKLAGFGIATLADAEDLDDGKIWGICRPANGHLRPRGNAVCPGNRPSPFRLHRRP
jgi:serine/threonine-protein kinase